MTVRKLAPLVAVLVPTFFSALARADGAAPPAADSTKPGEPKVAAATEGPAEKPAKPKPPPYSLPFQLRSAMVANVVRSDTSIALFSNDAGKGSTVASMLLASYKVTPELAPFVRFGFTHHSPVTGDAGNAFVNPAMGATYSLALAPDMKLAFFLGLTAPIGAGGGNTPDPATNAVLAPSMKARSAMDNAMFAVNDFTVFPGIDFAWITSGLTVQVEATLLQLMRVRGEDKQVDKAKTNLTLGLHLGYFVIPQLSLGAELRHQRWLSTPAAVEKDTTGSLRDTTTFAVGLRGHIDLGDKMWLRPGVSFSMPIDDPMAKDHYKIVQIDLPFVF